MVGEGEGCEREVRSNKVPRRWRRKSALCSWSAREGSASSVCGTSEALELKWLPQMGVGAKAAAAKQQRQSRGRAFQNGGKRAVGGYACRIGYEMGFLQIRSRVVLAGRCLPRAAI